MDPTLLFKFNLLCILLLTGWQSTLLGQVKSGGEVDISQCWAHDTQLGLTVAADNGHIYVGSAGGRVEAIGTNGKKIWESDFGGSISSRLLPLDPGLLVVTTKVSPDASKPDVGTLRSVSKETGISNWSVNVPGAGLYYLSASATSVIVVSDQGQILFIDLKNGSVQKRHQLGVKVVAEPIFAGSHVVVAVEGNKLWTVPLGPGEVSGKRPTAFRTTAIVGTQQKQMVIGDERGNVSVLGDRNDRREWQFRSGGEISRLFAMGENILAVSHDNFIYLLSGANGSIVWKKRASGRVSSIGLLSERFALLSGIDDQNAVLIDLSNGKTAGQIAFGKDEKLIDDPLMSNGRIYVLSSGALQSYSLDGCLPENQKAAPE